MFQGDEDYGTIIPRREIPKWFTHRSAEASLKIKVPSDLCDKLMGIVVCAVFVLRQHHPIDQLHCKYLNWNRVTHELWCHVNANKCENSCSVGSCFSEEFGKIESYHLFLRYYPSAFFDEAWKEASSKSRANGSSEIEIIFETRGPGLEVTKCGAELVFGQDIEDPNHTMAGCCSCSITRYEDDFDNSTNDTKIKRSLDDYYGDGDGDGAGPSGEGTSKSNDVDVPHPKRIRLPNLIERFILRFGSWFGNSRTQGQGDSDCEEEESQ
jgi:hypothetical protein